MTDVPATTLDVALFLEGERSLSPPVALGGGAIAFAVVVLAIWTSLAPIASAIIETGTVVVQSSRKLVQHPEGGVIKEILVTEGEQVAAGQVLFKLDDIRQLSTRTALKSLLLRGRVQQARLEAERDGGASFDFTENDGWGEASEVRVLIAEQRRLFNLRAATLQAKLDSLMSEQRQAENTMGGERYQLLADAERLRLTDEELRNAQTLARTGDGTRQRVLEVRRAVADLKGAVGATASRVAETQQRVEHARSEKAHLLADFAESVEAEVVATVKERVELTDKLANVNEQIARARILAPVAGRIVGMNVHTVGGLALAGSVLAEVVPSDDQLVIETQVSPIDAESINPGMAVDLRVGGTRAKNLPRMTGHVKSVSADRLVDHTRGIPFFVVQVNVDPALMPLLPSETLRPGMSIDVLFMRGERTPLQYLTQPFMNFFRHSLRE